MSNQGGNGVIQPFEGGRPLASWLQVVGFARAGFPRLNQLRRPIPELDDQGKQVPTADSKRFVLSAPQKVDAKRISDSLGTSSLVICKPGQGATTIARYAQATAEQEVLTARAIPVLVSFEDFFATAAQPGSDVYRTVLDEATERLETTYQDSIRLRRFPQDPDALDDLREDADEVAHPYFAKITANVVRERIETSLRWAVIRTLVTERWERKFSNATFYAALIGSEYDQEHELEQQRHRLRRFIPDQPPISADSWTSIGALAPRLADPDYQGIIRELSREGKIRMSLLLDLSPSPIGRFYLGQVNGGEHYTEPYKQAIRRVAIAVKNITQDGAAGEQPTLPSLLDLTYFISEGAEHYLEEGFKGQVPLGRRINFHGFRPVDVFAMLAHHYPFRQEDRGDRTELLAAVLSSDFIKIDKRTALSTEMALLAATMEQALGDEESMGYQLSPDPDTVRDWETPLGPEEQAR